MLRAVTTCYTGCTPTTTGITPHPPAPTSVFSPLVQHAASGLAFTGADIAEMAFIGVLFVVVGLFMWRASRRPA